MTIGLDVTQQNDRDTVLYEVVGIRGENLPYMAIDNVSALTSGTTRFGAIPFRGGTTVSTLKFMVSAVASGVTTIKAGLYDTSGNRLAASANTTSAMSATGITSIDLATPYAVPSSGMYLAALLVVASGAGSVGIMTAVTGKGSSSFLICGTEAGQTDLDATATISSATSIQWWGWA